MPLESPASNPLKQGGELKVNFIFYTEKQLYARGVVNVPMMPRLQ